MKSPRTTREELERLLGVIRRCLGFWKRALVVFVLTALVAGPYSITRPRSYKSETVILYQETIRSADLTGGSESSAESGRRLGARLREALFSRASLEPIVTNLHLYADVVDRRGLVDAVDEMRKHITFRAREGDTFEISFEGGNPEEVQEVTRSLGECIVKEAAARRAEHAKVLKEFVDVESERNKLELKEKEGALANFLASHPEFKRPPGSEGVLPGRTSPPAPDDQSLAALEARAAILDLQLRNAGRAPAAPRATAPVVAPAPDSPELVAARRDLAEKLARFTDKHPDVLAARARVRAAEANQAAAVAAAQAATPPETAPEPVVGTEAEKESLRQQLAVLNSRIAARRASLRGASSAQAGAAEAPAPAAVALEVEFRRLQREVNDARERQRQLDEKQFKASISASSAANDRNIQVSILDPAYRPTHAISRPRSTLLGIALAICFVLALLTAVISAQLDDRIRARADLEHLDLLPVLGVIPRATTASLPQRAGESWRPAK